MKQKHKKIPYPLEYIEWDDHASSHRWAPVSDVSNDPVSCVAVGWVIAEDKHNLTLSASLDSQDSFSISGNRLHVIKSCITFRKKLKV